MPSRSQAQQKFFGAIKGGAIPRPKGMSAQTVEDFASTPRKGLPQHVKSHADGTPPMTNTTFQQSETESKKRPDWMERVPRIKPESKTGPADSKKGMPYLADGHKPSGFRVRATKIEATPLPQPEPTQRGRRYFGQGPTAIMADGKSGHWMADAFKNAGKPGHSLHASLHVAADKKIPAAKLSSALHSDDPHMRKMANLARNANS